MFRIQRCAQGSVYKEVLPLRAHNNPVPRFDLQEGGRHIHLHSADNENLYETLARNRGIASSNFYIENLIHSFYLFVS